MYLLFSKVAGYRSVILIKKNFLKGSFKDFPDIKSHLCLWLYSLGTANYMEHLLVVASVSTCV